MDNNSNAQQTESISMIKDKRTLAQRKEDAETRTALNSLCKGLRELGVLGGPNSVVAEYRRNRAEYLKQKQQSSDRD